MRYHERKAKSCGFKFIVGIDEVGRGPLAGPVVSCALWLKKYSFKNRIDDSKKLSKNQRYCAYHEIVGHCDFGIGIINEAVIDHLNIAQATKLSMQRAISNLSIRPDFLLIDGRIDLDIDVPCKKIIDGDRKSLTIAAASIIAKVIRDRIMEVYHKVYPKYGFKFHKGYATEKHLKAIRRFGPCSIHRLSFRPLCDE